MPKLFNSQTRAREELDGDELTQALASGSHAYQAGEMIEVKNQDGELGTIPSENVQKALSQGYKVVGPSERAVNQYVEENKGLKGSLKVGLNQLVDEFSMGLPELVFNHTADPMEVAKFEALKKDHELSNVLGGSGGFIGSLLYGGPLFNAAAKGAAKTTLVAEKILATSAGEIGKRTATTAAKDLVKRMAAQGAGAGVEGAILTAPHAITEAALGDPDAAAESLLYGVGLGAMFGAGGEGAKSLFKVGKDAVRGALTFGKEATDSPTAKLAARKLAKVITGVDEDTILKYANNHERINQVGATHTLESVKDEIDSGIKGLRDKIEIAKENAMKGELDLSQAYNLEKQRLMQTRAPETLAPEIMGTLDEQKSVLGDLSNQLLDVNAASAHTIKTSTLKRLVTQQMNDLAPVKGGAILGEAAKAEQTRLAQLRADLDTYPKSIDMVTTKKIINQINPDINYSPNAGSFNEISDKNKKAFRAFLNENLKTSPEAADILGEMSRRAQILNKASQKFGTLEKATSALRSIATEKGKLNRALLDELSSVSGKNFSGQLAELEDAASLLNMSKVQDIKGVLLPEKTEQVFRMKQELDDLKLWNEPIERLTEARTQNIIRNQGFKTASIEDRKALEFLSQQTGKDYVQLIDDLNVFEAFKKSNLNGSRRAVAGATIGGAIGGFPGAAIGSTAGTVLDYFGGALLKKVIDGPSPVAGILFAEQQMKKVAEKLDEIPKALEGLTKKSPGVGRAMSLQAIERALGDDTRSKSVESRAKKLMELTEKSSTLVSNPEAMTNQVARIISPLSQNGAPNIAGALGAKYNDAMAYVFSQAPKPPRPQSPFAKQYDWKPSDAQLAAFEQKMQTVLDPFSVFDDLARGTLTKNHVEALKKVYPKLFEKIQERVQKEIISGVKPVPYQQRIKLSLLLQAPMDISVSPQNILNYQKTFLSPENQGIDPNNKKEMAVAQSMASDVDKLMG